MNVIVKKFELLRRALPMAVAAFAIQIGAAYATDIPVTLSGSEEAPPVETAANGAGTISISDDKSVRGSITTSGVEGIAAHIHVAAPGKNGPPVIALVKTADNIWSVPAGSKLSDEQYASFKTGELYVNVHSSAHKAGEIRGQLKP